VIRPPPSALPISAAVPRGSLNSPSEVAGPPCPGALPSSGHPCARDPVASHRPPFVRTDPTVLVLPLRPFESSCWSPPARQPHLLIPPGERLPLLLPGGLCRRVRAFWNAYPLSPFRSFLCSSWLPHDGRPARGALGAGPDHASFAFAEMERVGEVPLDIAGGAASGWVRQNSDDGCVPSRPLDQAPFHPSPVRSARTVRRQRRGRLAHSCQHAGHADWSARAGLSGPAAPR
jgi:hypothetical protein